MSQEKPIIIHKKLDKLLVENLNEVLAMYNCGIKLTFTDIKAIKNIMEKAKNYEYFKDKRMVKIK